MSISQNKTPGPDEIWAILKEVSINWKISQKEAEKRQKRFEEELKQSRKDFEEKLKKREEQRQKEAEQRQKEAEQRQKEAEQRDKKFKEEMKQEEKKFKEEMKQRRKNFEEELKKREQELKKKDELWQKNFEKEQRETNKRLKKAESFFHSQWSRLLESLVEGDLIKVLKQQGIEVKNTYTNLQKEYGEDLYEYDIIAGNGEEVVVVEVKTTLRVKYVKEFLEDLQKFTSRQKIYKGKTIYGAVAFLRAEDSSKKYAERQGLLLIRATGDSASIVNSKNFKPKVFS